MSNDTVVVKNPKALAVNELQVERIPIGITGDYKPNVVKLANGDLLLAGFAGAEVIDEYVFFYRSRDGGRTWSDREYRDLLGREPYLSIISDGTIFISVHVLTAARDNNEGYVYSYLYRSSDDGKTWQWIKAASPDKSPVGTGRNVLELHDGSIVFAAGSGVGSDLLWRSTDRGKTWDMSQASTFEDVNASSYPGFLQNEAYLWQAPNRDLISVCRVSQKYFPPIAEIAIPQTEIDHYERMLLYRSKDGGRKWTYEELGSHYGEMYPALLKLADGRLLLTYTVRAAVEPHEPPLGVRAVLGVGTSDGLEFDFEHDIVMLDTKTPVDKVSGGGFGGTIQLDDGTLVTSCSYRTTADETQCELVRWRLPE